MPDKIIRGCNLAVDLYFTVGKEEAMRIAEQIVDEILAQPTNHVLDAQIASDWPYGNDITITLHEEGGWTIE